jgi:hypothetical protein
MRDTCGTVTTVCDKNIYIVVSATGWVARIDSIVRDMRSHSKALSQSPRIIASTYGENVEWRRLSFQPIRYCHIPANKEENKEGPIALDN